MQFREPARGKQSISLTPLIDVVFLLLVFFMLASTFLQFGTVKLDAATAGGATANPVKMVFVHVDSSRRYKVNGVATPGSELVDAVNRLVEQGARDAVVIVRGKTSVDDLIDAVRLVRESQVTSLKIVE